MGRAERRMAERRNRIEQRKDKVLISREDLNQIKKDIAYDASGYHSEAMMTCFALALSRHGFDADNIGELLVEIDGLFTDILEDRATMDDYVKELDDETGIKVVAE